MENQDAVVAVTIIIAAINRDMDESIVYQLPIAISYSGDSVDDLLKQIRQMKDVAIIE